jgi:fructokinase
MEHFGAVEAGGTKFICGIGDAAGNLIAEQRIETLFPTETLPKVVQFFQEKSKELKLTIKSIGIGSFGPLDLNPLSPAYGHITSTPKTGWPNTDIPGFLRDQLNCACTIDTDVNAAAYGEYLWGAGRNLGSLVYFTIGTGIGGGAIINGLPIHGLVHPEMGHCIVDHDEKEDPFSGVCPYHSDCFEGLANGPSIQARWGIKPEELPSSHPAWDLEARYIARALHSIITILSPQRIILGGGVMQQLSLLPKIRLLVKESLNGYVVSDAITSGIDGYIVAPVLGKQAGVLGSLALAIHPPEL